MLAHDFRKSFGEGRFIVALIASILIAAITTDICSAIISPQQPADPHQKLEQLAWIVGDWTSTDSETSMSMNCHWSDDGNFLLVEFRIVRPGSSERVANERIAWDPSEKKFRSWTFRNDGSFGEATWSGAESDWKSVSRGILPDGQTMTSTIDWQLQGEGQLSLKATDVKVGDKSLADSMFSLTRAAEGSRTPSPNMNSEKPSRNPTTNPKPDAHAIENVTWEFYVLKSVPVEFDRPFKLKLVDGDVEGTGGVNRIGGRYTLQGNSLRFRYLTITNNDGPAQYLQLETILREALESVDSIQHQGTELQLMSGEETVAQLRQGR